MKLKLTNGSNITIRPYDIAVDLQNVYLNVAEDVWPSESALQAVAHSLIEWKLDGNSEQPTTEDLFDYLNFKLESVRKTISYWDSYQIYRVLEDYNLFESELTSLPNNSSIVNNINTPFHWLDKNNNEHWVYQGDVFVKDYAGNIYLIPATNKGVYVPIGIVQATGNSYTIQYQYKTEITKEEEEKEITFAAESDATLYDKKGSIAPGDHIEAPLYVGDNGPVKPIVKCFYKHEDNYELLFNAHTLFIDSQSNKFTITNISQITIYYEVR